MAEKATPKKDEAKEKAARDPFKYFYIEGESEESKQKLREMVGRSATQLVQPTPSAVITNPDLLARIQAAEQREKERAQAEQQQEAKKPEEEPRN